MKNRGAYSDLGFDVLRARLLDQIRRRIQNGEITERALARKAGISQPHLHNMLKGIRGLNPTAADQLLARLGLTALDLLESTELRGALSIRSCEYEPWLEVQVLKGRFSPESPWPDELNPGECVKIPMQYAVNVSHQMAVRLGLDRAMEPALNSGDLVLLQSTTPEQRNDPDALFAIVSDGRPAIRWLRTGRRGLYVLSAANRDRPADWDLVTDTSCAVRAHAIPLRWMHPHEHGEYASPPPHGKPRVPARPFSAN